MANELDTAEREAMPDSAYAFPRLRKEPLNDASHVRNAIARFDQVRDGTDAERREAFDRIRRAAKKFDVEITAERCQDLGKPSKNGKSSGVSRSQTKSDRSEASRDELYAEAKRRDIAGRSSMTKDQLKKALGR